MIKWIIIGFAAIASALAFGLWFAPVGVGEYKISPDGCWRAEVWSLRRGTWRGTRQTYLKVVVESVPKGTFLWKSEWDVDLYSRMPDYGNRQFQFINWSTDSSQFTAELTNGVVTTFPLMLVTNHSIHFHGGSFYTNATP